MKHIFLKYILLLFFVLIGFVSNAQKHKNKPEQELIEEAAALYKAGDYVKALPLYSQLLSLNPKDPYYSYRFGVCLMYGDRRDIEKPLKYLNYAADKLDKEEKMFFHLGLAHHLNFRFPEAIKYYEKYGLNAKAKKNASYISNYHIMMCRNGLSLLAHIKDLYVISKKEVNIKDFYRSYDISGFGGSFLLKPDFFKSKLDKKKKDNSIVFFSDTNSVVYFSSYGKKGEYGKDIYRSKKMPNGKWAKAQRLSDVINSVYDEDYPYILPDGKTLYFCSKGHSTMGGYDIFKSVWDTITNEWGTPQNLDFAINTPFDDILFVTDDKQQFAYFSSVRNSVEDYIMVYKVRIDERPDISETDVHYLAGTDETDSTYLQTVMMLQEKAKLNVNTTMQEMLDIDNQQIADDNIIAESKIVLPNNISKEEIIDTALNIVELSYKSIENIRQKTIDVYDYSEAKREELSGISEKIKSSEEKLLRYEGATLEYELEKIKQLKNDVKTISQEINNCGVITSALENLIIKQEKNSNLLKSDAEKIKTLAENNNIDSSKSLLVNLIEKSFDIDTTTSVKVLFNKELKIIYNEKKSLAEEYKLAVTENTSDIKSIDDEIKYLKDEINTEKNDDIKNELQERIKEAEKEKLRKEKLIEKYNTLYEKLNNETNELNILLKNINLLATKIEQNKTKDIAVNNVNDNKKEEVENIEVAVYNDLAETEKEQKEVDLLTEFIYNENDYISEDNLIIKDNATFNDDKIFNNKNNDIKTLGETQDIAQDNSKILDETLEKTQDELNKPVEVSNNDNIGNANKAESYDTLKIIAKNNILSENDKSIKAEEITNVSEKNIEPAILELTNKLEKIQQKTLSKSSNIVYQTQEVLKLNKQSDNINKKADELNKFKYEALLLADKKNTEAELNKKEAEKVLEKYKEKNIELSKEDSVILILSEQNYIETSKEAKALIEIAEKTGVKATQLKNIAKDISDFAIQLNKGANQQNVENIILLADSVSEMADLILSQSQISITIKNDNNKIIKNIENNIVYAEKNITYIDNIILNEEKKAEEIKTKETNNKKEKQELINEAELIQKQIEEKIAEKTVLKDSVRKMKIEVAALKFQVNYTSKLFAELNEVDINNDKSIKNSEKPEVIAQTAKSLSNNVFDNDYKPFTENIIKLKDIESNIAEKDITEIQEPKQTEYTEITNNIIISEKIPEPAISENIDNVKIAEPEISENIDNVKIAEPAISENTDNIKIIEPAISENIDNVKNTENDINISNINNNISKPEDLVQPEDIYKIDIINKTENINKTEEIDKKENIETENNTDKYENLNNKKDINIDKKETLTLAEQLLSQGKSEKIKQIATQLKMQVNIITSSYNISSNKLEKDSLNAIIVDLNKTTDSLEKEYILLNNINEEQYYKQAQTLTTIINKKTEDKIISEANKSRNVADSLMTQLADKNDIEKIKLKSLADSLLKECSEAYIAISDYKKVDNLQEYQTEKLKKELLINKNKELINLKEISTYNIEADVLNAKASEIRDSISNNKVSLYYAETLLNKADSLEKLAVQKQKIIISIIRRQLDEKAPNDEQLLAEAALYKAENITNKITNNTSVTSIIKDEKKSISKAEIIPNEDAKAVDKTSDSEHISNTKGLFYTVQVGVFGSPRTKERLFNLAPLFFEQMTNGYYRYLAGIYQNRQNAQQARVNNIIQYVPDAFVVAYYNGSRITMQEAAKMENENIVKANEQPLLLSITNVTSNIAENQETKEKTISEGKIEFKVQIGAFRKEIDANALENFKQKTGTDNITFYTNAANLLCYTAGSFETQAEAQKLRLNIISAGISDAFVVAFMGGNRISLQRAN